MKKLFLTLFIGLLFTSVLTGCSDEEKIKLINEDVHTFKATVIECESNSMIVMPDKDEQEYKSSDKFRIAFGDNYKICNENERVKITYNGGVNESYPAQIAVTKIEMIKD